MSPGLSATNQNNPWSLWCVCHLRRKSIATIDPTFPSTPPNLCDRSINSTSVSFLRSISHSTNPKFKTIELCYDTSLSRQGFQNLKSVFSEHKALRDNKTHDVLWTWLSPLRNMCHLNCKPATHKEATVNLGSKCAHMPSLTQEWVLFLWKRWPKCCMYGVFTYIDRLLSFTQEFDILW